MFKYCKGWPEKSKYTTLSAYNMWGSKRCGKFKLIFLVRYLIYIEQLQKMAFFK